MFFPRHDLVATPVLEPDELDRVADGEASVDGAASRWSSAAMVRLAI